MVQNSIIVQKEVYYQLETTNKSFLNMHYFLRDKGIKNNKFFLVLLDSDLAGIDPRDPRLNTAMKTKVLRECIRNYWYYLREVVRIPDSGGQIGAGKKYELHRGNLAFNFCVSLNLNIFYELPRQQGKTIGILVRLLWEFNFGTTNSEMSLFNKKHDDSKLNLQRLRELRSALPAYLQMSEAYSNDGKKLRPQNSVESLQHPTNKNRIKTLPAARNKVAANSLGRGTTTPRIWFDEYGFTPFNSIIYSSAIPAYKTAAANAIRNGAPYGILISTTPGVMTTDEGVEACSVKDNATPFSENWYDMNYEMIQELISKNTNSSFVYIRYDYKQLGLSEEWFRSQCIDLKKDWPTIRREILLEWSTVAENSPFKKEDLDIVKTLIKQPIQQIQLSNYYTMNIYEQMSPRSIPLIGVDVSGGFQRDSSAITVVDSLTTRVTADLNCNYISTVDLAKVIHELVTKFMPSAVVNIERNGGYGASVLSKLIGSSIKRNLYYEIKDKVIEERFNGTKISRKTQKTKIYGLDSSKDVRELLMQILRERMEYHKDKFISPIIYSELETLEVKRSGKIEHSSNGHDDQVFSYLMALYIWYEGKDLMERYGIQKTSIKTDSDLEEACVGLEEKYEPILTELEHVDDELITTQLETLNQVVANSMTQFYNEQAAADNAAMQEILSTKIGREAYARQFNYPIEDLGGMNALYNIPDSVFSSFYE